MINTFVVEGKIKEMNLLIKMNKFILIENENASDRLCLVKIYLSDKLSAVLSEKCDIDDLICVQGHIENVFNSSNEMGYVFVAEKLTMMMGGANNE